MTKIMIVEDEMIIARELEEQLQQLNYEVIGIFTSSEAALEFLHTNHPDLILMDIVIQGERDGIELAELINKKYAVPIVFISAYTDELIIERVRKTIPCGFVVKPYTDKELRLNIEIALYKYEVDEKIKRIELWYATHDPLTKLYNRHYLDKYFETLMDSAQAHTNFCVMMVDIDNFKAINDTFGHLVGDDILRKLAIFLRENLRKKDIVFRYGGEEFLIILVNTGLATAGEIAEALLKRLREFEFFFEKEKIQICVSIGLASYPSDGNTMDSLIKASDEALYEAKKQGKNRVKLSNFKSQV